jgi:5-(carboxyamino)imidazole ribonucleotide mutase
MELTEGQTMTSEQPRVGVIMGSKSDWDTMRGAAEMLSQFGIPHECRVVSAHRTPDWMAEYAKSAQSRGLQVIIAGAGGAAHLPGMVAAQTTLPVLGVPVQSRALNGLDSLLSIVQMPGGIPVATLAIGTAGSKNAGLLAARILALSDPQLQTKLQEFQQRQTDDVLGDSVLPEAGTPA